MEDEAHSPVIPTSDAELLGELGEEVDGLREPDATVGGARTDVELTPVALRL